jgi:hypothetical protein
MRCPKNKQCPKQQGYYLFDDRPICTKCDKKEKIKRQKKINPVNIMTDSLSAVLNKDLTARQKKILKRNDRLIHNIEKAHRDAENQN